MSEEFKRWLALYFIDKGNWKITDKAVEELGQDATPRQTMEFGEMYGDREREERIEYDVELSKKERKKIAHMKIAGMIDDGKAEELYSNGYITDSRTRSWKNKTTRITVLRKLVEILDKDPRDLTVKDFRCNKLASLLWQYYRNFRYEAVKESFPEMDIKPWEMAVISRGLYDEKENRIATVKWLVGKLGKNPIDLKWEDFRNNGLASLLHNHYNSSPYEAVKEAGLVTEADENYMRRRGGARFKDAPTSKQAREAARRLARNAGKTSKQASGKARRQKNSL